MKSAMYKGGPRRRGPFGLKKKVVFVPVMPKYNVYHSKAKGKYTKRSRKGFQSPKQYKYMRKKYL